jgi:hypothetical protein
MKKNSDSIELHPTHTCFDDAAHLLIKNDNPHERLCHGLLWDEGRGCLYCHAWVESPTHCFDFQLLNGERVLVEYEREEFYERLAVREVTSYTLSEAISQSSQSDGLTGPWNSNYRRLCRD